MGDIHCSDSCLERQTELEKRSIRAVEGAVRVARRLKEVEDDRKRDTVKLVVYKDAQERISWLEHSHGTPQDPKPCARCIAQAAIGEDA